MPSFEEDLSFQMQQMRQAGEDPTEGVFSGTMPRINKMRPEVGFFGNVYDEISMQPIWLRARQLEEGLYPSDPDFVALTRENLKGYEQYASTLREARSAEHLDAMKRRIDDIEYTKQRLMEESGILPAIVAEIANPINYIPFGFVGKGVGFVAGAMRGAASIAPLAIAEETLRSQVDPTATRQELLTNTAMSVVLGGMIGGGIGMIGGPSGVRRLAAEYDDFQRSMDGNPPPARAEKPLEPLGSFEARPTEEPTGLAPAFGFATITNRVTAYRRLLSKGYTAVEDLANAFAGEFDVMFNRNKVQPDGTKPSPTQRSAFLESGSWSGRGADIIQRLDNIYNEYLGGSASPTTIGNINLPVTMQRIGQAVGVRPADDLMTYQEFMDAVFKSHKRDKIESDNPFVLKAANTVREFFDLARDEGVKTGFLLTKGYASKALGKYQQRAATLSRQIDDLQAKDELSAKEKLKLDALRTALKNTTSSIRRLRGVLGPSPRATVPTPPPRTPTEPERWVMEPANVPPTQQQERPVIFNNKALDKFVPGNRRFDLKPDNDLGILVDDWDSRRPSDTPNVKSADEVRLIMDADFGSRVSSFNSVNELHRLVENSINNYEKGNISFYELLVDIQILADNYDDVFISTLPSKEASQLLDVISGYQNIVSSLERDRSPTVTPDYQTGKPFVADTFHGTKNVFDRFLEERLGQNTKAASATAAFFSSRSPITAQSPAYMGDLSLGSVLNDNLSLFTPEFISRFGDELEQLNMAVNLDAPPPFSRSMQDAVIDGDIPRSGNKVLDDYVDAVEQMHKSARGFDQDTMILDNERKLDLDSIIKILYPDHLVEYFDDLMQYENITYTPKGESWVKEVRRAVESYQRAEVALSQAYVDSKPVPSSNVRMVRVRMDNPLVHDFKGQTYRDTSYFDLIRKAKADGHDGVVMLNTFDGGPKDTIYAAFSADQMRTRFYEPERAEGLPSNRVLERMVQRPSTMPEPANQQVPVASLRGAGDLPRPQFSRVANENVEQMLPGGEGDGYVGPAGDPFYLPRVWIQENVLENEDELRSILFKWFKENPPSNEERLRLEGLMDDIIAWKDQKNPKDVELLSYLEELGEWRGLSNKQYDLMMELRERLSSQRRLSDKQWDLLLDLSRQLRPLIRREDYLTDDANIMARVDEAIKNIIGESELGEQQLGRGSAGGSFRRGRSLDIPNELVTKFIETDVSKLVRSYSTQAGIGIEYARMFGTREANEAIDDVILRVIDEIDGPEDKLVKEVNDIRDELITLRDLTLGDAYARNPTSMSRKTAQFLSAWATITQMGGAVITALVEPAKLLMIHGVQRTLNFAMNRLEDPDTFRRASNELRILTSEGMETTLGMHMMRVMEQGGLTGNAITKAGQVFDKATRPVVNFAQGSYYKVNLLAPFTDILKTYALTMSSHFMIEDIRKIAAGKASKKTIEKLATYGISEDTAKRIAAQPIEKLTRLNVANTSAWDDPDLVRVFAAAVRGETRRTVVTAGPANKPTISQGFIGKGEDMREVAFARLPFQYLSFGFAAVNKNLLSALQGRDANAFVGAAALIGMGYMVARLKTSDAAWEQMETSEKILRAVNNSGVLAIFADIPNMIETATRGEYGLRPMLGMPPAYGGRIYDEYSPLGLAVGPGGGKVVDMYRAFVDDATTAPEQARAIRRMVPLNDLFYWKSLFTTAERGLTEQLY